jgi:uncharacterized protein (DUF58 family)
LGGRETLRLSYEVKAMRRGYYRLGPLQLTSGDFFGFELRSGSVAPGYITVYPRIHPIARLRLPSRLPFGTLPSKQRLYADPARPIGVRPFRSGDTLRHVNWKVSARLAQTAGDDLMVRTLEPAISLDSFLLLNLNREDYARRSRDYDSEWAIEVSASLAAHLTQQRQAVGIATNGRDLLASDALSFDERSGRLLQQEDTVSDTDFRRIAPRSGRQHLIKVLELLARVELQETTPFVASIPRATLHLSWGTTIVVVTPVADLDLINALHRLVRAGYNPILMLVAHQPALGELRERSRRLGFLTFSVLDVVSLEK